jgi:AraC family transcriptional regulator
MTGCAVTSAFFGSPLLDWRGDSIAITEQVYRPGQHIGHHAHDEAYVCVVLSGGYRERSEGGERDCRRGSVLIHPAGSSHSDRFGAAESRLLMLEIAPEWRHEFTEPQIFDAGPAVAIGARLHEEAVHPDDATPLAVEGLALELMALSRRECIRRSAQPPAWLRRARERIDDTLPARCAVRDLAAVAGVHAAHFSRVFRAHFGCTVAGYVRRQRIGRAKEAIAGGRNLAEAAIEAGFADQSDLTRAFRRVDGITPAEFRRRT